MLGAQESDVELTGPDCRKLPSLRLQANLRKVLHAEFQSTATHVSDEEAAFATQTRAALTCMGRGLTSVARGLLATDTPLLSVSTGDVAAVLLCGRAVIGVPAEDMVALVTACLTHAAVRGGLAAGQVPGEKDAAVTVGGAMRWAALAHCARSAAVSGRAPSTPGDADGKCKARFSGRGKKRRGH